MPEKKTVVVNIRGKAPYDIYIGRVMGRIGLKGSPFANPFKPERDAETIEEILEMYEAHVRSSPELMELLPTLEGQRLGCWCKPNRCHGDVLVKLLEELKGKKKPK